MESGNKNLLPEADEDFEGSEMEVLGNMTAAKFDVVDNKDIDLKSKKYKHKWSMRWLLAKMYAWVFAHFTARKQGGLMTYFQINRDYRVLSIE
jgi:hypothetical protein